MLHTSADNTQEDQVAAQLRAGFWLVRLHSIREDGSCSCGCRDPLCTSRGKHPVWGGDLAPSNKLETVQAWLAMSDCNLGIHLERSGLAVIGPDSLHWLQEFERRGLPSTYTVQTGAGAGHRHYYYRRTSTTTGRRLCRSGEYDILSSGYVVAAGSRHASGRLYTVLEPMPDTLPVLPAWAETLLTSSVAPAIPPAVFSADDPPVVLSPAALQWWTGARSARAGNGTVDRSETLYAIGVQLARAGASGSAIVEALRGRDRALNLHKYSGRDDGGTAEYAGIARAALAARVTDSGDRNGTHNGVYSQGATERAQLGAQPGSPRFRVLSAQEVLSAPPPQYLISGYLIRGTIGVVYGPSGHGKSFLVLDWLLRVCTGMSFAGRPVVPGAAVYVAAESSGMNLRLGAWINRWQPRSVDLAGFIMSSSDMRDPGEVAALVETLHGQPVAPALIVLDTLAWSMLGGDENKVQDIMLVLAAAKRLNEEFGATVLIVHHTGKKGDEERGSSALRAGSDTMIKVTATGDTMTVEVTKQKDSAPPPTLWLRRSVIVVHDPNGGGDDPEVFVFPVGTSCVVEPVGDAAVPPISNLRESDLRILAALQDAVLQGVALPGGSVLRRDMLRASGLPETSFDRALQGLLRIRAVERGSNGAGYVLTQHGMELMLAATNAGSGGAPSPTQ